jgi:hypothetical protein
VWHSLFASLQLGPVVLYSLFYNVSFLGWGYGLEIALTFLVLLMLFLVLPFVWGRRAQRWWVPGQAYGLGACLLTVPELIYMTVSTMAVNISNTDSGVIMSLAWMSAVAYPLALAASFAGW